ncbi:iron complex transport system ATP-binding protein [Yoonia tamlensis]|uniref:Iron complex transport system ATP-binding protein n=1 Tax=Yoonia tamlensis TaxID=390270 RepID=A0A1I6FNN0_9RHOB|nr:ABC transporter ATP-binding protein [Yoonia tamlensis]SFR31549.1 iron complex transport system ATP-binding protein [Yoonia tamlensis]
MTNQGLTIKDVSFAYAGTPVLHDVSATFAKGRLTAICGPNGCGKSTLLNIAAAQLTPSRGAVHLDGQPLAQIPPKSRAKQIAMLPQSPHVPSELKVRDLVGLGRYAHRTALSGLSVDDHDAIDAALKSTKLDAYAHRPIAALSGGQKQRAWISMTLAQSAPWVLLDEPTNHLDVTHAVETIELLWDLVQAENRTVVVVLHDLNLMARFADDVILMDQGRIIAQNTFAEAVTEKRLSAIYKRSISFGHLNNRERPFIVVD